MFRAKKALLKFLFDPATAVLTVRVATMALTLLISVALARLMSPKSFGAYSYLSALIALLAVPSNLGIPALLVKELSLYRAKKTGALAIGLLKWGRKWATGASLAIAVMAAIVLVLSSRNGTADHVSWFDGAIFVGVAFFATFTILQASILQGLGHVKMSQMVSLADQISFTAAIILLVLLFPTAAADPFAVFAAKLIAQGLLCCCVGVILSRLIAREFGPVRLPRYEAAEWFRGAFPFILTNGAQVLNAKIDIAMVGSLLGADAAGFYQVGTKGQELLALTYLAFGIVAAPKIAAMSASGGYGGVQALLTKGSMYILASSTVMFVILVACGKWLITVTFGAEYVAAYPVLVIFCVARQIFNMFGLCDVALQMVGDQKFVANTLIISVIINVLLNYVLIRHVGLTGAAWATGIALLFWNIVLSVRLATKFDIDSGIITYGIRKTLRLSKA